MKHLIKYNFRKEKNKVDDNGNRIGYWEFEWDFNGKLWCGYYGDDKGFEVGLWYLVDKNGIIIRKVLFDIDSLMDSMVTISVREIIYKDGSYSEIHIEEHYEI